MPKLMADCTEHAKVLTQVAMNLASRTENKTLDDVLARMAVHFPEIERTALIDAIVTASTGQAKQISDLSRKLQKIKAQAKREHEPTRKARIQKSITEYERRISEEDYWPKRSPEIPMSKELERMAYQRDMLRRDIRRKIAELRPRTLFERIKEPFNFARAILSSMDLSGWLRQGGFVVFGHPLRGISAGIEMVKAARSDQYAHKLNSDILNRPNAPLYMKSKLYLAPLDSTMSKREEEFLSNWFSKIPGLRASERAYITVLNKLRVDTFDAMMASMAKNGEGTLEEAQKIALYVNEATGRGSVGGLERSADTLATFFFSPRYTASRFQMLFGHSMWGGTWRTRKLIAREYGRYMIGIALFYGLIKLFDRDDEIKIEPDPRSSDFGKLQIGKTRIDPLSGLSQTAVLVSRVASGKSKSSVTGQLKPLRGADVPFAGRTVLDVLSQFARSKASPLGSLLIDVAAGETYDKQPVTIQAEAKRMMIPLSLQDVADAIRELGVAKGSAAGLASILGMGLQVYQDRSGYIEEITSDYERFGNIPYDTMFSVYESAEPEQRQAMWKFMVRRWNNAQPSTRKNYVEQWKAAKSLKRAQ